MDMGLEVNIIFAYALGLILLYIVGWIFLVPLKLLGKLIMNGIVGGIILFIFNLVGGYFGLNIVMNPVNSLVVGFMGIPGLILILALGIVL